MSGGGRRCLSPRGSSWWDSAVSGTWVIVPVRLGSGPKSRLSTVPPGRRAGLAIAFAQDTLSAAARCPGVAGLIVVGDEAALSALRTEALSADDPGQGLNAAIAFAARLVPAGHSAAALLADLPAVTPDQLTRALEKAHESPRAFVCDTEGVGTTLLVARDPDLLDPQFGERSRAAHAASGAIEIVDDGLAGLRRDVDDEVALWDAVRLGVGTATRAALG